MVKGHSRERVGGREDEGARGRGNEITMTMTLIRDVVLQQQYKQFKRTFTFERYRLFFVLGCYFFSFYFDFSEIKCNFAAYFTLYRNCRLAKTKCFVAVIIS